MGCHIGALAGMFLPARVLRRGARGFLICVGPFVFCTEIHRCLPVNVTRPSKCTTWNEMTSAAQGAFWNVSGRVDFCTANSPLLAGECQKSAGLGDK